MLRLPIRRARVIALLVYQALFFNVFLPGHTRGAMTLDGKHHPHAAACCCGRPDGDGSGKQKGDKPSPSQRDRDNCAVCNFAARVTAASALNLKLPELTLSSILPPPAPLLAVAREYAGTYLGRGPPATA